MVRTNFFLKTVLAILLLFVTLTFVSEGGHAIAPLSAVDGGGNPQCAYAQELVGKYGIKIGGVGLIDKVSGGNYSGTFNINNVPGTPYKAYLYWTIKKENIDASIKLKVNSGGIDNISATSAGRFGPAKLLTDHTTYSGYIVDLASYISSGAIHSGNNTFTISKPTATDMDLYGAGILLIYSDNSMPSQQHIEIKCGFDGTWVNDIGNDINAKWGEWSNVVCHDFPADVDSSRNVQYYAFMSGTKRRVESPPPKVYRPNAFWYKTGSGTVPQSIRNLNTALGTQNGGLNSISGSIHFDDLFNANSDNEWDTINMASISIPEDHEYICFQTQSRNVSPTGQYGMGSSMQWSMSALSFSYAGGSSSPTPTPLISNTPSPTSLAPTSTPTPSPTPIVYYPWINTIGGNAYSNNFNQMSLNKVNQSNSNRIQHTFISSINTIENISAYLSSNLFLQKSSGGLPLRSSKNNFDLSNYQDGNKEYRPGFAWFVYLEQYLTNTTADVVKLTNPNVSVTSVSDIPGTDANKVNIIMLGASAISIDNCDRKTIFVIDGDLQIDPNLIVTNNNNGCLFVVRGKTTVTAGNNLGSTNIPPLTNYDQLNAYFITGLFETTPDSLGDGLYIWGGVVETADSASGQIGFNRDIGVSRNEFSPSEVIEYDPRYLYIYGDLLSYSFGYNIRESQYIRSL